MSTESIVQPQVGYTNSLIVNLAFDNGLPANNLGVNLYSVGFGAAGTALQGAASSSTNGRYVIVYNPNTTPLNLQVRVVGSNQQEIRISKTMYNAGTSETLNLVVPSSILQLGAEYDRLSADIATHIGPVINLAGAEESTDRQDLSFLYQATNWDARPVALLATAIQHPAAPYLESGPIYALTRLGLPSDPAQLAMIPWPTIEAALTKAAASGIVKMTATDISSFQTTFAYWTSTALPTTTAPGAVSRLGVLLPPSGGSAFLDLYVKYPNGGADFWNEVRELNEPGLNVPTLQLQGKFLYLTQNNASLTAKLQQDIGSLDKLSQLPSLDYHMPATWVAAISGLLGASGRAGDTTGLIPSFYALQSADPLTAYAADMARQVRLSFPVETTARDIETGTLGGQFAITNTAAPPPVVTNVTAFLRTASSLGYAPGATALNKFLTDNAAALPQLDAASRAALFTLHRLYALAPSTESLNAALTLGFTSARDIASYGKDQFMTKFAASFPSPVEASLVYSRAQMVSAVTFNYAVMAKKLDTGLPIYAMSGTSIDQQNAKNALSQQIPSMSALFGSTDFCQCDDCRSVLSPAAYFVDLLQFLGGSADVSGNANANGYQPLDVLIGSADGVVSGRRPDLGALPLTCENTNTAMPYIDLVNQIFEYYILNSHLDANAAYDTGASTTADLTAEPQHILPAVYSNVLTKAVYPLNLPFDLWIETVRGFLNYFKLPLTQVLDVFRPEDTLELFTDAANHPYYLAQILTESLGLSSAEYGVLTVTDPATQSPSVTNWFALYGYGDEATALSDLKSAKTLAQKLNLTYQEVADLAETGFINPGLYPLILQFERFGIEMTDAFIYTGQPGYSPAPPGWTNDLIVKRLADIQSSYLSRNPSSGFVADTWLKSLLPANYTHQVLVLGAPAGGCDFSATTLLYADGTPAQPLDYLKLNLFVRLWKKLGWSLDEIDRAMQLFFPATLPAWTDPGFASAFSSSSKTALVYLAHLDDLNTRLNPALGRTALLPLWSNLPVKGPDPLYAQLFLTFGVLNQDWAFDDPNGLFPTSLADFGSAPQAQAALSAHQAAIQAVLGLSADEISAILSDAAATVTTVPGVAGGSVPGFNLANLSICYRYSALAKCFQLPVLDLIALKGLSGLNPFPKLGTNPLAALADDLIYGQTLAFIKQVTAVQDSNFTVDDLQYLLREQFDPVGKYQSNPNVMTTLMQTLAAGLQQIQAQNALPANLGSVSESLLDQILSSLFPATILRKLFALLGNSQAYTEQLSLPAAFDSSTFSPQDGLTFDFDSDLGIEIFGFTGLLLNWQIAQLKALNPATNPAIDTVLAALQQDAQSALVQSAGDLLGVWASLVQYESVLTPAPTAIADPELLEQTDPALGLAYDQTDQLQWMGYRGVLTDAKLDALASVDSSAPLKALLLDIQGQAMPACKQLMGSILAMWTNTQTFVSTQASATAIDPIAFFQALATAQQNLTITAPVPQLQFSYSSGQQTVTCAGVLTDAMRAQLTALSPTPVLAALLEDLHGQAVTVFQFLATELLTVSPADLDTYTPPFIGVDSTRQQRQIKAQLVQTFVPLLTYKQSRQLVVQTLSSTLSADATLTDALISDAALLSDPQNLGKSLLLAFLRVGERGISASYYTTNDCTGTPTTTGVAPTADTSDPTNSHPAAASARFEGYLQVATDGPYRFSAELLDAGATALLQLDSPDQSALFINPVLSPATASQFVELQGGVAYHFALEFHTLGSGGARLLVQGETLPRGPLGQIMLYPQQAFASMSRARTLLGKVIQILQTTGIGIREFSYFMSHSDQFANLKLSTLPTQPSDDSSANAVALFSQLLCLIDYADLRQGPVGNSDTLINVFEAAGQSTPQEPNTPWTILANLTRRDPKIVQDVAAALGSQNHFINVLGIRRLWDALKMVQTIGIPVASLAASTHIVSTTSPGPDQVAASFKSAVQAQFTAKTWRPVAQSVFDPLRQKKRDALAAYLVQDLSLQSSNQLFEYFLVDPGMEPVVQTSRLRLALSSVQTFVQRCLLGLEDDKTNAALNVAPSAIDADMWEWMKRYRVWQASREIFLFPENWMEPELRTDKTDLFEGLESSLLQGDVTSDLVEDAFHTYLQGLDKRARLDIVATYLDQNVASAELSTLHVLARTYGHPHSYFYRTLTGGMWSAWQAVTFDIESDHIVLAVWKGRLNIFWVTFLSKPQAATASAKSFGDLNSTAIASLASQPAVQVQLHQSEYFNGTWSTRTSSDINSYPPVSVGQNFDPKSVYIHVSKETNADGSEGAVRVHLDFQQFVPFTATLHAYLLLGINSPIAGGPVLANNGNVATFGTTVTVGHSFRVTSKNCNPTFSTGNWQQGPSEPYDAISVNATSHTGAGLFNVLFESEIAPDSSGSQQVVHILDHNDSKGFDIVTCANPVAPSALLSPNEPLYWQAGALSAPFFYKEIANLAPSEECTFFVQPSLTEWTMLKWEGWSVPPPLATENWSNANIVQKIPVTPQVPASNPAQGFIPDPKYSQYTMQSTADWITSPETLVSYNNTLIGQTGGMLTSPTTTATASRLNVVGTQGLNVNRFLAKGTAGQK